MPPIPERLRKPHANGKQRSGLAAHLANGKGRLLTAAATVAPAPDSARCPRGDDDSAAPGHGEQNGIRVGGVSGPGERQERAGIVGKLCAFLHRFIVLPDQAILVVATWCIASWVVDAFDRFGHLAVTSPEKRCGKTRLLQLIEQLCRVSHHVANMSAAVVFRLIARDRPTLLLDEAQSLIRRGSEASEVIREIYCASIDHNAKVLRVGGRKFDSVVEFPIFSPKVIACIGDLDGTLADRCLPVRLERKSAGQVVEQYRSRVVEAIGAELRAEIEEWTNANSDRVRAVYDDLQPFPLANDRLAELLLPLQAVLTVADPGSLPDLRAFAVAADSAEIERDRASAGVLLLSAIREIFGDRDFLPTVGLLCELVNRPEEPWGNWSRGNAMTDEQLARLLRPFGIRPEKQQHKVAGKNLQCRGYFRVRFADAWQRYCPLSVALEMPGYSDTRIPRDKS
ncbi:MAG: DUF3631 domain-containing protein [Planctomycetes bacterium]|nr:DUF3631 domain-containing protein [Planctomycetota bacterium]